MKYAAFLRAINVGGHNVRMETLRSAFEDLGFDHVSTVIASGNVLFSTNRRSAAKLETEIETHLRNVLGYDVATFLRSSAQLDPVADVSAVEQNFREIPGDRTLYVGFTRTSLSEAQREMLLSLQTPTDALTSAGPEIYWAVDGRLSESKITNGVLERKLRASITFRNITTVRRMAEKLRMD